MHPTGHCMCYGEGTCLWCRMIDANDQSNEKDDRIAQLERLLTKVVRDNYPDSVAGYCDCDSFGGPCIGCQLWDAVKKEPDK